MTILEGVLIENGSSPPTANPASFESAVCDDELRGISLIDGRAISQPTSATA